MAALEWEAAADARARPGGEGPPAPAPSSLGTPDLLAAARSCLSRGWAIIPVPLRQKGPIIPGWESLRLTVTDLPLHFSGPSNLGVLLGAPSGGLVDVDLDSPGAVALADSHLPPTGAVFGRAGKPRSHRLYIVEPVPETRRFETPRRKVIVELRGHGKGGKPGLQTVLPGSVHPSGERVEWASDGEPARVGAADLIRAVESLARACGWVEKRTGPAPPLPEKLSPGERHRHLFSLAGSLRRRGTSEVEILASLRAVNVERCDPPLPDAELVKMAKSAAEYPPAESEESPTPEGKKRKKPEEPAPGQGRALTLTDPEPWPEPVAGAALLDDLSGFIRRKMSISSVAADTVALWVLHTHAFTAAQVSPILLITSPRPRCGKSRLLSIVAAVAARPLAASSATPAAIYRAVEKWRPTLILDEFDAAKKENEEMRAVLNSGHTPATAYVLRTVGEDHEPRHFSTWAPKAVGLIGATWETLEDRAVRVEMRRRAPREAIERMRAADLEAAAAPWKQKAVRWVRDAAAALADTDAHAPPGLDDRCADNWSPLLALADAAGGTWSERARAAALALSGGRAAASSGEMLLSDLRTIFDRAGADRMATADLLTVLGAMEERPWRTWGRGRGLTAHGLARLLAPFDVAPSSDGTSRGYARVALEDAWSRYIPPAPSPPDNQSVKPSKPEAGSLTLSIFGGGSKPQSVRPPDSESDALTLSSPPREGGEVGTLGKCPICRTETTLCPSPTLGYPVCRTCDPTAAQAALEGPKP